MGSVDAAEIAARGEVLKREARGLQDALRPLVAIEALGEDLLTDAERERKGRISSRLAEIRGEADELGKQKRASARERRRAAKEAEAGRLSDAEARRSRAEERLGLWTRVTEARRARMYELGAGGVNSGGQPRGSAVVVDFARKVDRGLDLQYGRETRRVFDLEAHEVRSAADDAAFGVRFDKETGELQAVGADPFAAVRKAPSIPTL